MGFINKHRKAITVLSILLCIVLYILSPVIWKNSKIEKIELVYYISQIISSIFVIAGVIIAVWQYYISAKSEIVKANTEAIQRAINLAEYYKDNILENISVIDYVYDSAGIGNILKKIHSADMINFDVVEMNNLLNETDINKLHKIQESDRFVMAVIEANKIFNLKLKLEKSDVEFEKNDEKEKIILKVNVTNLINTFMSDIVSDTLNNMEFFAMHFIHNTADESVVYQSLHQTYTRSVQMLYYTIAKQNTPNSSYLYTNVIELYKKWNDKHLQSYEKIINHSRSSKMLGSVVEKID